MVNIVVMTDIISQRVSLCHTCLYLGQECQSLYSACDYCQLYVYSDVPSQIL